MNIFLRNARKVYLCLLGIIIKVKVLHGKRFNSITLKLISDEKVNCWRKEKIFAGEYVHIKIPKTIGITSKGEFFAYHPASYVLQIEQCSQFTASDVLRVGNQAFLYKIGRHQENKEIFTDSDLLNYANDSVTVTCGSNEISVGTAFSLLGVNSTHWAHFLVEYLPKLLYCKTEIESIGRLVIEKTTDEHFRALISEVIPSNVEIIEVEKNTRCVFDKMLYCMPVAYLCNHANYALLNDVIIPTPTRTLLRDNLTAISDKINLKRDNYCSNGNVYIAFQGKRGPVNAEEIEDFFRDIGYLIVHPHKLSFEEKVKIFSNAKNVVGVGCSGFSNLLFNKSGPKVLIFLNYERQFDTYLSQFSSEYPGLQISHLIGMRAGKEGINSSYYLGLDRIKDAIKDLKF